MNIPKLPETLKLKQIQALRKAFGHFYDQENGSRFVDKSTGYSFSNVTDFVDYLYSPEIGIPKGTSAKHIGITLESWYETRTKTPEIGETTMTPIPKAGAESNTLTPEQLRQLEEEAKVREEEIKKTRAEATKQVGDSLKKKQEVYQKIQESLKNKKIYAKVNGRGSPKGSCLDLEQRFLEAIHDDLKTPRALAVFWDLLRSAPPKKFMPRLRTPNILHYLMKTHKNLLKKPRTIQPLLKKI